MEMRGEERIAAPREQVWGALNDPAILRRCIPGCQLLERNGEDRLNGIVEVRIGPIGARFKGIVTLSDVDPPNGYTIAGEGQGGIAGSARGGARVRLADDAGGTLLSYEVDAQVGGRLAQLGGPIIDATAKQHAGKFFKAFAETVGGSAAAPARESRVDVAADASSVERASSSPSVAGIRPALPTAWILALVVAALAGFLIGRSQATVAGSDWAGLAIGSLVVIVAAAGFEFGRRSAAPVVVLDAAAIRRLADAAER